jgi:hypothetical protein
MSLELTDLELETAARACRALAYQEEQAAKRMENPAMRGPVETSHGVASQSVEHKRYSRTTMLFTVRTAYLLRHW